MKNILNNYCIISLDDLKKEQIKTLKRHCSFSNPVYYKTKAMGFSTWGMQSKIKTYLIEDRYVYTFRGNFDFFYDELDLRFKDQMQEVKLDYKPKINFEPYSYQKKVIDDIVNYKDFQGIISAECSAGKTFISMALMHELKQKTLVIVHNKKLMKQWESDIKKNIGIKKIGLFYGQKKTIGDVTIGLMQSVNKYTEQLSSEFGMVILDECHKVPANTFLTTLNRFPSTYRFGLSGSLERKDKLEFLIPQVFGPIVGHITESDISDNRSVNFKCEIINTDFNYIPEDYEARLNYNDLLDQLTNDRDRNKQIIDLVMLEVFKNNNKCIIISDRVRHCKKLNFLLKKFDIRSELVIGGREDELGVSNIFGYLNKKLTDDELDVIVGTPECVKEGMSIPVLSRAFVVCPCASNDVKLKQQKGRITRFYEGKDLAKLYYFLDQNVVYFSNALINIKRVYGRDNVIIKKGRN